MLFASLATPFGVATQEVDWRVPFGRAERARQDGDLETYASSMAEAVSAMPAGLLNRPFAQYHAARANALLGRPEDAVRYLRMAWDEGLESLMISYAAYDAAFDLMREDPGFVEVMGLGSRTELEVEPIAGNLSLLTGAGANVVASVGRDGVLLFDTGYAPALAPLRRALASLGGSGVSVLVLTHAHEDHVGSAAELGRQATVVAHEATDASLREPAEFIEGVVMPAKPTSALADVRLAGDTTFSFNGDVVRIHPMPSHTAGDVVAYLDRSRALVMGDVYLGGNPMMFPGTSDPDGFLDGLSAFLDGLDPATVVIGGHDAPTDLEAVRGQIEASRACMAFVRAAIAEGLSAEETLARGGERHAAPWIGFFYRLFTADPAGA